MTMTRAVATSSQAVSPELICAPSAAATGAAASATITGTAAAAARTGLHVDRLPRMHPPCGAGKDRTGVTVGRAGLRQRVWAGARPVSAAHGCTIGGGPVTPRPPNVAPRWRAPSRSRGRSSPVLAAAPRLLGSLPDDRERRPVRRRRGDHGPDEALPGDHRLAFMGEARPVERRPAVGG